ncbi:hypothetical protein SAMN02990966_07749 [Rhodospirillales bacterium URHD0017]|nr:hypothetical protein SAMN02990966_07749 [Rhodospirillales bacterium URHD0017]
MAETAKVAAPIAGDKLYQQRARQALPLLVRQAHAGEQIIYSELAEEMGMPNERNLNYVLGSVGQSMELLSKAWKEKVPPIQCLVVNKNTGLPGEGVGWFIAKEDEFAKLPRSKQREIVKAELAKIFAYTKWPKVLEALSLRYTVPDLRPLIRQASGYLGGEGEEHKRLKAYLSKHPEVIGLALNTPHGSIEEPLPSGDSLDVSFRQAHEWVAAEVKPAASPVADILRGLYQCVKYKAVMEAVQATEGKPRAATAVLVLQGL